MRKFTTKRALSILLAVCMLVSLLPVGMMAGALDAETYNDGNAYYRYNMHILSTWYRLGYSGQTQYLDAADYSESIWQMAEGHSAYTPHYDSPYPVWVGHFETDYITDPENCEEDYVSDDPADIATDPWMLYEENSATALTWESGAGLRQSGAGGYITLKILVGSSGSYIPRLSAYMWANAADPVALYIAPIDAENPRAEEYKVGSFTSTKGAAKPYKGQASLSEAVELSAGEYYVTVAADAYLGFCALELIGDAPEADVLTFAYDETALSEEGYIEVPAGESVSVNISGESAVWGPLALDDYDQPTYARVDTTTDAISAAYENGVVTITANRLDADPTNSATLLYVNSDAAAWIEIPVKVVPGSQRILTLGHTGRTDNLVKGIAGSIALTAAIDGEDMDIIEEDEISVEIVDADGAVTDAVSASVAADGTITFIGSVAGSYTANISATIDGVAATAPYEVDITINPYSLYYNYMKASKITTNSVGWRMEELIDSYSDTWTGGWSDINTGIVSDGWIPGDYTSTNGWLATSSAQVYGAYWLAQNVGDTVSNKIFVPVEGTYTVTSVHSAWSSSASLKVSVDGVQVGEAMDVSAGTNLAETPITLGTVTLTAGEHVVTYEEVGKDGAVSGGYFIKGLKLEMVGDPGETLAYIDVDDRDIAMGVQSAKALNPKILPDFLDTDISYSFSDDSFATYSNNSVAAINYRNPVGGYTQLTFSAEGAQSKTIDIVIDTADFTYKFWTAGLKKYQAGDSYANIVNHGYVDSYATSLSDGTGSDGWFVAAGDTGAGDGIPSFTFNWGASVKNQGNLAQYGNVDGAYTKFQIQIVEDGVYRFATEMDMGATHISPSATYLAPVDAEDPTADEYLLGKLVATRAGGQQNSTVLYDEVELTAGDYYLTVEKLPSARGGYDYLTHYDYRVYKMDNLSDVDVATVDGAQIRTTGKQGLRFISSISKTTVDWSKVTEYGTILLPTADLTNSRNLVIGAEYNGHAVAKVPAVNKYAEDDTSVTFTAVITDIAEANYARSYTARAYAILEDGSVVYGDTFAVRSIYEVAKNGIASGTASESDLAVFQAIVDVVDGPAEETPAE